MKKRQERRDPEGEVHPLTRHDFLSPQRFRTKLLDKQKTIRAQAKKIARMEERLNKLLQNEGVPIDEDLSSELKKSRKGALDF